MKAKTLLVFHLFIAAVFASYFAGVFINFLVFSARTFQIYGRYLIWLTPMAGLGLYYWGEIKVFRNAEKESSPALVPYTYFGAIWSQLFGASCGREGAAVQIGGSAAEFFRRQFRHEENHRLLFAHVGVAAAFAMALGTPISAIAFALEHKKHPNPFHFLASLFGSGVGFGIMQIYHVNHWYAPEVASDFSGFLNWHYLVLVMGLWFLAQSFYQSEQFYSRVLSWIPLWITLPASGVVLGLSSMMIGDFRFNNFSTDLLDKSFTAASTFWGALGKIYFTFLSLSGGWKGGAFVPLMVGGGLTASWLSSVLGLPLAPTTALGVFSVLALKFDIPITAFLISGEMFGWKLAILTIPIHLLIKFVRPKIHWEKLIRNKDKNDHTSRM